MAICNAVTWQHLKYRADVNRFFNPSIEIDTTGFTASGGAISQSATQAYVGAYSLASVGSGAIFGWRSTSAQATTPAATYTFKAWLYGVVGVVYRITIYDTYPGVVNSTADFTGTGAWQLVTLTFTAGVASQTYQIQTTAATTGTFYTDAIEIRNNPNDTYIDGDQIDCIWNGAPHNSSSLLLVDRRGGGEIVDIAATYLFKIGDESGAGMLGPKYKELDRPNRAGTEATGIKVPRRMWQLGGIFDGGDFPTVRKMRNELSDALGAYSAPLVDGVPQPVRLRYVGAEKTLQIDARYAGGLDNAITANTLHTNRAALRLLANDNPYWYQLPQSGDVIDGNDDLSLYGVSGRVDGAWTALNVGAVTGNGDVFAIAVARNGNVFIGGDFTQIDGVANTAYCAYYSPLTGTWFPLQTGVNGIVRAILPLPDGRVVLGGEFTNAGGDANADYTALYDPSTDTLSAPGGAPLNGIVYGLAIDPTTGEVILVGAFTQSALPVTLNRVARLLIGGNYAAVGSVTPGVDGTVFGVGVRTDGQIIIAGQHTEKISAIASGGTAFYEVGVNGGANGNGLGVYVDLDTDTVYVGGAFTTFDTETAERVIIFYSISSTYVQWETMGGGFADGDIRTFVKTASGEIYAGGSTTECNDLNDNASQFLWTGSRWIRSRLVIATDGSLATYAVAVAPDGTLYQGGETTAPTFSQTSGLTAITLPDGAAATYPVFEFMKSGTATGEQTLVTIENFTTGSRLVFDSLNLLDNEIVRVDCQNGIFWSSVGRNLNSYLLDGNISDFYLQAGANDVYVLVEDTTADDLLSRAFYHINYETVDAAEDDD